MQINQVLDGQDNIYIISEPSLFYTFSKVH
ncbi:SdiA-regulated domain-containing protein [Endozoicomonas sp. SM1973]|uniref:SdiA-regulated domain-containing protein n=1 Tax=Spartinivicinus marinus TaxID=2994442 RepID=A0A853I2I3_9GAMM|nr:SdiA-regulated domain-containing protein [Spartinivicinus marinus]